MVSITVSIEEEVLEVLRTLADHRGVPPEDILREMLVGQLSDLKARMADPVIGVLHSGRSDLSERYEEFLLEEWKKE
jgi:hypothetical protein